MIRKNDTTIASLESWERLAGPKRSGQWQDHRSAKECARAWLGGDGGIGIPAEIARVLASSEDFSEITAWEAEPECLVRFDGYGGPANIDVLVVASDARGAFPVIVEAKADESFGPILGDAFTSALERRLASPSSRGLARLEQLATSILPPSTGGVPHAREIRYQLLTATAAALAKAGEMRVDRAVVMVHEFQTSATDARKLEQNRRDLLRFLTRLGGEDAETVFEGKLLGPIALPGAAPFEKPPALYFGKAVRRM
jgi:hypothetical protein